MTEPKVEVRPSPNDQVVVNVGLATPLLEPALLKPANKGPVPLTAPVTVITGVGATDGAALLDCGALKNAPNKLVVMTMRAMLRVAKSFDDISLILPLN